jgi:diguanylate cyclase (GGDEF)-like protein
MQSVSSNQDFSLRLAPHDNDDEIGELAKNFNSMLENLDKTHTELNQQKDHFSYKAHHDVLTNLPNRALFNDRLEQAITKARRHKEEFALFFIDLDHFKQINDTLGHEMGDEVLKFFAKRLNDSVRTEDTIARIGGDEFMVIMESLQTPEAISVVANKIVSIVKEPIVLGEETLHLGTSIGISVYPQNGETAEVLLKNADTAMYKAKNEGRDNYQFYTPEMKALAIARKQREVDLREAVEKEAFVLYYQPRLDLDKNKTVGYVAGVKWRHAQKGLIDFSEVQQLSKDIGLFVKIERWLVEQAIKEVSQWRNSSIAVKRVIVGLSLKTVLDKAFVTELKEMLERHQCQAGELEISISEDELEEDQGCVEVLKRLDEMGVLVSINNFGVTSTSLRYLSHLPVHSLQLDGSLIANMTNEETVIKSVAALANSMNLALIVADIELEREKKFLHANGYNLMQGIFFGAAVPVTELSNK